MYFKLCDVLTSIQRDIVVYRSPSDDFIVNQNYQSNLLPIEIHQRYTKFAIAS